MAKEYEDYDSDLKVVDLESFDSLTKEIREYAERYEHRFSRHNKFLYLIIEEEIAEEKIIYFDYALSFDEFMAEKIDAVARLDNLVVFIENKNDLLMNSKKKSKVITNIAKDIFPEGYLHFREYGVWPIGPNIHDMSVYKLTYRKDVFTKREEESR